MEPFPTPFASFSPTTGGLNQPGRAAITGLWRQPEPALLPGLMTQARLPPHMARATQALALRLATGLRERSNAGGGRAGLVQGLLQQFSLSSQEGVALMCLAEALLRIPDSATRDALIRDKIARGQWQAHVGKSPSLFVNAAAWGLLITGRLVATHSEGGLASALGRLIGKGGEPLVRKGVDMAMRMMGEQFVTGETIAEALRNAQAREAQGFSYSYDMLGEAALTAADAARYLHEYEQAIHAIGAAAAGRGIHDGPGISIKLSALHPRYSRAQYTRVMDELLPIVLRLAELARGYGIGLNIDAEESDRLELSLDLLEALCQAPSLRGWDGIGFVVQAYQKRCPAVIEHLVTLARASGHRLMVRLVKGAYWDSEIKRAQVEGQDGYPVYTRKCYTDIAYLACARRLLDATDAVYPQFATHNAHTLAAIHEMADPAHYVPGQYEFQCLHGMGEPLYEQVVGAPADGKLGRPCRIYAPVGTHETLLAYLVRRLLENGANTSFVNRIADPALPLEELVRDPVEVAQAIAAESGVPGLPHAALPLPGALYGAARANSAGMDLSNDATLLALGARLRASASDPWSAAPMPASALLGTEPMEIRNPADRRDLVGQVQHATLADVDNALRNAMEASAAWSATSPAARAALLEGAADRLESSMPRLMGLLVREAGKTCANAIAEMREAVDFLRYYAAQVKRDFDNTTHVPLGAVVCISPWNFPLAIFTGQIAAALAAGNTVLAKPAEQTPLIAAEAVRLLWAAGVPRGALQLLPGPGETVGAALVADARVQGVMFTGSTEVARLLQATLARRLGRDGRPVPLIAETGGQNAMIVDSSALPEQVVTDVLASAFDSAGQRCSALRVLCVQEDVADHVITMLEGSMAELRLGNPDTMATDVGPVIDTQAQQALLGHVDAMRARGCRVFQHAGHLSDPDEAARHGRFVAPTLIEIQAFTDLEREVFGPVLHVLRYARADLDGLLGQINGTGYGLTLGVHTRIDETITRVVAQAHAGNVYVNRNMVGAVVGVQPFGGEGLSGTGPKAGGPMYLLRLLARRPGDALARALDASDTSATSSPAPGIPAPLAALRSWLLAQGYAAQAAQCERFAAHSRAGSTCHLNGPTGERNTYALHARTTTLCLAQTNEDLMTQLAAVLATAGHALLPVASLPWVHSLPEAVRAHMDFTPDWKAAHTRFDAMIFHGNEEDLRTACAVVAQRPGPLVGITALRPGEVDVPLERLLVERAISVNTAAAGGNASLMAIG